MRIFVLTATYELRVSRKSHLRDHPTFPANPFLQQAFGQIFNDDVNILLVFSFSAILLYTTSLNIA
jgi:hypothetical protein